MKNRIRDEITQALNSNEYVISTQIGKVAFADRSPLLETIAREASRSDKESNFALVKFTAQCALSSNSSSVDVESLITESFAQFLNTTVHLEMEGIIYISEAFKQKIQDHLSIMNNKHFLSAPDAEEFDRIMTDDDKSYCKNDNQWTSWFSTDDVTDGSDLEILENHVKMHRFSKHCVPNYFFLI